MCVWVCIPLRAVIHGGLFQTMPLYRSPFILAPGCLGDAGALWQILKEGRLPAAFLYEETQLESWLYCLKGAVQPKVKESCRNLIKWRKGGGKQDFIADLLSVCSKSSQRQMWCCIEKNHTKHDNYLLLYRSRRAKMNGERWDASAAGCKCKERLMGRSQMRTGAGITYSGVFVALNQSTTRKGNTFCIEVETVLIFLTKGREKSSTRGMLDGLNVWGLKHVTNTINQKGGLKISKMKTFPI